MYSVHIFSNIYIYIYVILTYIYIYMYVYIFIYIYIYIYIYMYVPRYLQPLKVPLCNDSRLVLDENGFTMGIGIKQI